MCAFVKGNLNFAAKAVVPAQKSSIANSEPVLIVNSTPGSFTLSSAATLAMSLEPGQSVAFADNLAEILKAVAAKQADVVACFEENGLDINNVDDCEVFVKEMREVYIYKGYALLNADGTPKMGNARTSKEEKEAMLAANFEEILAASREAIVVAIKADKGDEYEPSEDEVRSYVTIDLVGSKQEPAVYGSKTATTSNMTGLGLTLKFTDNNIWTSLKRDIEPDTRARMKRTYKLDLKNPSTMTVNDGQKDIEVTRYMLIDAKDEEVTERGSKSESAE